MNAGYVGKRKEKACLWYDTIKKLKPVQVRHQVLKRICRKAVPKEQAPPHGVQNARIVIPELDADSAWLGRFDMEALLQGRVCLLHECHRLDETWQQPDAAHLWNYNLHYLEFLLALAAEYKASGREACKSRWMEIMDSWLGHAGQSRDAYEPYVISMRMVNVLAALELLGSLPDSFMQKVHASLYSQYRHLIRSRELALLANHYFENLKAILIGSIYFGEPDIYRKFFPLFLEQVKEQVLPDGMHFERSMMYHRIVLEGMLRVCTVQCSAGLFPDARKLFPAVRAMAGALRIERGLSCTPLFNDAGNNVAKPAASLAAACARIAGREKRNPEEKAARLGMGNTALPYAGYFRLDSGRYALLFDCGDIGPEYMGGHAHDDCLSFELYADGKPVFANSGTGQYQGECRGFFRSAEAHNTVMIDDREPSQLWGDHRAGRRISGIKAEMQENSVCGQFRSCQGDIFKRRACWKSGSLHITDILSAAGSGSHTARLFFHLAPGFCYARSGNAAWILEEKTKTRIGKIVLPGLADARIHTKGLMALHASDFGRYEKKQVLEICSDFREKTRLYTEIQLFERAACTVKQQQAEVKAW